MSHFLSRFVIIDNPHHERNGQRAQVVDSHRTGGSLFFKHADPRPAHITLTLRFSDGAHCEMMATGVYMDTDQVTPVWPPVDKAPVSTEASVTYKYMDGLESIVAGIRPILSAGVVRDIRSLVTADRAVWCDSRDPRDITLLKFLERSPLVVMKLIGEIRYLKARLISADREAASLRDSLEALKAEIEQLRKPQPEEYVDDEDSRF